LVYAEFERMRLEKSALTFDDFIPLAIDILESNSNAYERWCRPTAYLIVDEYQDINRGQQRLIELLLGDKADAMVVGDDDQTIYEWRGARPNYILQDFERTLNHRPMQTYTLSHSFRFGPTIAMAAGRVISLNTQRVSKPVIAHHEDKTGFIQVYNGGFDADRSLAEQVQILAQAEGVSADQIAVLARLYAQMDNLEAEFLQRSIPYRVDGHVPFFKRSEVKVLLDYLRLCKDLGEPLTEQTAGLFLSIANRPNRMLSRNLLEQLVRQIRSQQLSLERGLNKVIHEFPSTLTRWQLGGIRKLYYLLIGIHSNITSGMQAWDVLSQMVEEMGYLQSFQDYYGDGEHADGKIRAVENFLEYTRHTHLTPLSLLDLIARLDTTQGAPLEEQVVFTTIFRTKGLEFDYVFLPECNENALPYLKGERVSIFDKHGRFLEEPLSSKLESERRLFYVAITRARKGVFIGTGNQPSRFLMEMESEEVPVG
jgi:DNA helicase-2/ATP-dependent DNA helicase PcrA